MVLPKTLLELIGAVMQPSRLDESALLLIDCQNTYTEGPMRLSGVDQAIEEIHRLLLHARSAGIPIFHIAHDAGADSLFDVRAASGAIVPKVAPQGDEPTIIKKYPNSFAMTDLHDRMQKLGVENLIVGGFMTHGCVNSTVRAGSELGYRQTVVGSATATRDLPTVHGNVLEASVIQDTRARGGVGPR